MEYTLLLEYFQTMKYTEYFKEQLNTKHSEVNLCNLQLLRLLEIVTLESSIMGNTENGIKVDTGIYRYRRSKTLNQLTNRKTPQQVWQEMIKLS